MNQNDINKVIDFIKDYYKKNSFAKGAIIGMSGGKDSLVAAKLCIEALGKDKVFGVIMPNGEMLDIKDAEDTCKLLGIKYTILNIKEVYDCLLKKVDKTLNDLLVETNDVTKINISPRIRMMTLYALGASMDYLVVNTSNLSETMVGYTTKWGDNVGDFAPLANFTKSEVCEIGLLLGLPEYLVNKVPSDGLSMKSDEEKMNLKYSNLDNYIRTGIINEDYEVIKKLNRNSLHKRKGVIKYENNLSNYLNNCE